MSVKSVVCYPDPSRARVFANVLELDLMPMGWRCETTDFTDITDRGNRAVRAVTLGWRCLKCRARGTVDVRHDAAPAEIAAFLAAAHAVVQPTCRGGPVRVIDAPARPARRSPARRSARR